MLWRGVNTRLEEISEGEWLEIDPDILRAVFPDPEAAREPPSLIALEEEAFEGLTRVVCRVQAFTEFRTWDRQSAVGNALAHYRDVVRVLEREARALKSASEAG